MVAIHSHPVANSEAKTKHLEFIQATINRMANNSFLLKGWAVTLVGGLLALSFKETDRHYLVISIVVTGLFWLLDSYYLSKERNFIRLYNHTRKKEEAEVNFEMDANRFGEWWHWPRAGISKTMLVFYGGLAAIILIINCYI